MEPSVDKKQKLVSEEEPSEKQIINKTEASEEIKESTAVTKEKVSNIIISPCATLYIRNLNERVKPAEVKETLYHLGSVYG